VKVGLLACPPLGTLESHALAPMAFAPLTTTATLSLELLMDLANASEEISSRLTARAYADVEHPE
jgi:hypothetical protein